MSLIDDADTSDTSEEIISIQGQIWKGLAMQRKQPDEGRPSNRPQFKGKFYFQLNL